MPSTHEQFNANDLFNNRRAQPEPFYRCNSFGGTLGGPIYSPKSFNKSLDNLFSFCSREDWRIFEPRAPRTVTVPTELERQGNFSQRPSTISRFSSRIRRSALPATPPIRRAASLDKSFPPAVGIVTGKRC